MLPTHRHDPLHLPARPSRFPGERSLRRCLRMGSARDVRLAAWLLMLLGVCFIAYVARLHEITHDAFHEMALVREGLVQRTLPQHDLFAYTPTVSPSVHHEWGTGAVLYFVTVGSGLGLLGLTLLKLALIGLLGLFLYRTARLRGAHPYLFAVLAFATFPVLWVGFATLRAQLFTLVFLAIQLWMQELDWRGRRSWVLLWLAMLVVWLNLHAGFVVGLGLIAVHSLERFISVLVRRVSVGAALKSTWHLWLAAPAAVCLLQCNPYGWQYIPYLIRAIGMPRPLIAEWRPLWHTYAPIWTLTIFALSLGLMIYALRSIRTDRMRGAAFLALCGYMTVKHIRHGSLYAVVWLAYVPAWISRTDFGKALVRRLDAHRGLCIRGAQLGTLAALLFATAHHFWLPTLPASPLYSGVCYPTEAVRYLKAQRFQGNLLTPFYAGSYVSWEMYPYVKVSLDGRYEVAYQEHVMQEHKQFSDAQGRWWEFLDKYPTDAALIDRQWPVSAAIQQGLNESEDIAGPMPSLSTWDIVYEDDSYFVLARQACQLPYVDRRGEQLHDGAWATFSQEHSHRQRQQSRPPTTASMAHR